VIQFFHVYKTYTPPLRSVLEDINFEIQKGEIVLLYGPTGAGKSTILKLLFGLEQADAGQILVLGRNILKLTHSALPYFRRNVGFVFQDFKLFGRRTVYENVALAMKVIGASPVEIRRKTKEALQAVGLDAKHSLFPSMLSAGEQQRVCFARAMVNRPAILLADEPTGNLDAEQSQGIFSLLKEINVMGTTVFVATHDDDVLKQMKPRIISVRNGKISMDGDLP
jgi:cell division transport system ATP-binding protein